MPRSAGPAGVEQEGLDLGIEVPAPPPVKAPKDGVAWFSYRVKSPVHCDVCLAEVHERWPHNTHAPNRAVYRRKEKGVDTYWCYPHYAEQRGKEGTNVSRRRV